MQEKPVVIALAGNPNSGKTSLFNFITGSRQHVGNYPGVTVEVKAGTIPVDDTEVTFIDLPGTYSLTPFSHEESVAREQLVSVGVDTVIAVVDTTRLERSLYLAAQLIETGKPVVIALNMFDEFENSGSRFNIELFSEVLGVPCIPTVGNRGKGVTELMATALKAARGEIPAIGAPPHYSHETEHALDRTTELIGAYKPSYNRRWLAVNLLLYSDSKAMADIADGMGPDIIGEISAIRERLEILEGMPVQSIVTLGRYGFAKGAVAECLSRREQDLTTITERIDSVLTHRILGLPIFLVVLWAMFQTTFTLGAYPMRLLELIVGAVGSLAGQAIYNDHIRSLLVDGIISGVGGVIVFLPNIVLLFFFISLLEDTGYMARAAFIMDKVMHFLGLHGKSFLPMLIGFGCTVPAVMATRVLETRRERLITMFILPFMSCGAKLPVYILLAGAFFGGQAGTVIFGIYVIGVILSFAVAKVISFAGKNPTPFVMELPPYRVPTPRSVLLHLWERAYLYLKKAGTVILAASIIMWFLVSYPKNDTLDTSTPEGRQAQIEHSFAGRFGKTIEPVLAPLGFDWRIGVALTTGFAAKEVVISTLATIYAVNDNAGEGTGSLRSALKRDPAITPFRAFVLMVFILIYVPCIAVLGVLKREAGGWKWVALMVVYTTGLAWIVSFLITKTVGFMM